jgi:hypothetical protein
MLLKATCATEDAVAPHDFSSALQSARGVRYPRDLYPSSSSAAHHCPSCSQALYACLTASSAARQTRTGATRTTASRAATRAAAAIGTSTYTCTPIHIIYIAVSTEI